MTFEVFSFESEVIFPRFKAKGSHSIAIPAVVIVSFQRLVPVFFDGYLYRTPLHFQIQGGIGFFLDRDPIFLLTIEGLGFKYQMLIPYIFISFENTGGTGRKKNQDQRQIQYLSHGKHYTEHAFCLSI